MRCNVFNSALFKLGLSILFTTLSLQASAITHDDLDLSGISSYWNLNNEMYVGTLWLQVPASTPEGIEQAPGLKRMEFRITADKWRQRNFAKIWARSISINNAPEFQQKYGKQIQAFSNMLKGPLLYGDKVTIDFTPDKGLKTKVNETVLFSHPDEAFFNGLVRVWTGPRPPSSDFKEAILRINHSDLATQDDIARYDYIAPDLVGKRNKEIAAWVVVAKPKPKKKPKPKPVVKAAPVVKPKPPAPVPAPSPTTVAETVAAPAATVESTSTPANEDVKPSAEATLKAAESNPSPILETSPSAPASPVAEDKPTSDEKVSVQAESSPTPELEVKPEVEASPKEETKPSPARQFIQKDSNSNTRAAEKDNEPSNESGESLAINIDEEPETPEPGLIDTEETDVFDQLLDEAEAEDSAKASPALRFIQQTR